LGRAMEVQGAGKLLQGKPADVEYLTTQLATDYNQAIEEGTPASLDRAVTLAAQMKSLRDASGGASPEATKAVNTMLAASGINEGAVNPVTQAPMSADEQFASQLTSKIGAPLMMEVSQTYGKEIMDAHSQDVARINAQRTGGKTPSPPLTE